MKNNKLILLFSLIVTGCVTTQPTVPTTPKPSQIVSTSSPSSISTPKPSIVPSTSPTTSMVSSTPSPIPSTTTVPYSLPKSGLIKLTNSYIESPDTAFLVNDEFNLKISFSLDSLAEKDKLITILSVFDNSTTDKKVHYELSLDSNKNLIIKAENSLDKIDKLISFPSIEINKGYELSFIRDKEKIELTINGNKVFSSEFKNEDFIDGAGRRKLHIGANSLGENKVSATIDYIDVKDTLLYAFNNTLADTYKYGLTGVINSGSFNYISEITATATPSPSLSPSSTPIPSPNISSTPAPNRTVGDTSGSLKVDLGVYNSKDNAQYSKCLEDAEKLANQNNTTKKRDCLDETGIYTTSGFDFGSSTFLQNQLGDFRFITEIIRDANAQNNIRILLAGSDVIPKVNIVDLGLKSFEGVTVSDLKERVKYDESNKIFSLSTISSSVIRDHVYAIRTNRYGQDPRYGKLIINDIITDDYIFIPLKAPDIITSPQFISFSGTSGFSPSKSYNYYISTFDGVGETAVSSLGPLGQYNSAVNSVARMEVRIPYGALGYSLYRRDNSTSQIYKIGPILSNVDQIIEIIDKGDKGYLVDSLPQTNNTVKNGFKPARDSKPIKVDFTYKFDGNMDSEF
ncbi:MAG: hypothetical protein U0354_12025 [Candidatus Sericytochromatia bacterium]